jgi:cobyrinic acid a,c-diamide synthase
VEQYDSGLARQVFEKVSAITKINMPSPTATVLLISAIASGQGKTSVTAALARKLCQQGQRVRVFKTGADFIDPMILARACGQPVYSLDLWLLGLDACRALLARAAHEADVILIEGVMGLYDGSPSSADLARTFGVPVLVVIDASAMAQTAGAVVLGLRDFGPVDLAGVVANRIASPGHAQMVAGALREVPLLASLPRQAQSLPERHLGLVLPDEVDALDAMLDQLAQQLQIDWAAWQQLPRQSFAAALPAGADADATVATQPPLHGKTIAIARDAAFAFIYPANLDCLRALGADLCFFSPLQDQAVPAHADALWLPGGYPELYAATLAQASQWQASVRAAQQRQMPILAECGGMMVLAEELCDIDGKTWPMAGLLAGRIVMQSRLAALGPQSLSTPHGTLRGHAFHFSRFETSLAALMYTHKPTHTGEPASAAQGKSDRHGEAVYRVGNLTASYFHAWFASCPRTTAGLFLPSAAL